MIKKALITSAGFGTRFLPISKTIQKEMLPILQKPIIDYVVEDLVQAGVEEIIFVINEHNIQIKHYYSENLRLYEYLKKMDKEALYQQVAQLHTQAKFTFIKQPDNDKYGTAVPVKIAEKFLKDEKAFFVFMGDDFLYSPQGKSEATRMLQLFEENNVGGVATFIQKPEHELHRYGIAQVEKRDNLTYLKSIVEKPAPGTAPSNLTNISKYIFTPEIFEIIENQQPNPESGELYITDSAQQLAQRSQVLVHTPISKWLDGGNLNGWLKANLTVAWHDPRLKAELEKFIQAELD